MQLTLNSTARLNSAPFSGSSLWTAMKLCSDALSLSNTQYSIMAQIKYNDITSVITKTLAQHGLVGEVASLYCIDDSTCSLNQSNQVKDYHIGLVDKAQEISKTLKVDIQRNKKRLSESLPEPSSSFSQHKLCHGHENEDIAALANQKMRSEDSPVVLVFTANQCADAYTALNSETSLSIDCAVLTRDQATGSLLLSKYDNKLNDFSKPEFIQMGIDGGAMMAGEVPQIIDPNGMQTTFDANGIMIHGKSVVMVSIFSEQTTTWRENAERIGVELLRVKSRNISPERASRAQPAGGQQQLIANAGLA